MRIPFHAPDISTPYPCVTSFCEVQ
jgi:hypothetical protein